MNKVKGSQELTKDSALDEIITKETVYLLYRAIPTSVAATVIIAAFLSAILWQFYDDNKLILWFGVVTGVNVIRYIFFRLYTKADNGANNIKYWDNAFYILVILNGLCFSVIGIFYLPDISSNYHYFPIMVLIGLAAGAVSTLSFRMKNIIAYFLLLLLPVLIIELYIGTFLSNSIAGLVLLSMIFSLANAKRIRQTSVENITLQNESKKYNQELMVSKEAAEKANTVKDHFVSMISHELRTPLNAILGYAQLLRMSDVVQKDQEHDEQSEGIISSGKHLLSLIEELLDLSEIQADQLKVELQDVSLKNALIESLVILNPVAAVYKAEITDEIEDKYLLKADHKRLKQVFINLIANAIKYNHLQGKVKITANEQPDGYVRISIIDNGNGLTEQQQSHLFEAFQRFDTNKEGIGLGLFITKKLIDLMQGKIGVVSKIDEGSTFWFDLPQAK